MHDPTDYKRELAAIQILLAASAQRQPEVTSLATCHLTHISACSDA